MLVSAILHEQAEHTEIDACHLTDSMEATIRVRVASGTWPDGFGGWFAVRAGSIKQHIVLLDWR